MAAAKEKPKKKQPERKCVGCNERREKRELVRVVRTPDGNVILDRTGKQSGRGAYLCHDPACLSKAVKARRLQTALACEIPETVLTALGKELTQEHV